MAAEGKADELIVDELKEAAAQPAEAEEPAEAGTAAADAEDPWAGIDAEVEAINAETQDKDKE